MREFGGKVAWRAAKRKAVGKDNHGDNDTGEAVRPRHFPPFIVNLFAVASCATLLTPDGRD